MVLQKQVIEMPFAGGMDTKISERLLPNGMLALLKNAVQNKTGEVEKRNGYKELAANALTSGLNLAVYGDELLAFSKDNAYSYSLPTNSMVNLGRFNSIKQTQKIIRSETATTWQRSNCNAIFSNGYYVYTWLNSTPAAQYSIVDAKTGVHVVTDTVVADVEVGTYCGTFLTPVRLGNDYVALVYASAGTVGSLRALIIDMHNPTAAGTVRVIRNDLHTTNATFCVMDYTDTVALVAYYYTNGANNWVKVASFNAAGYIASGDAQAHAFGAFYPVSNGAAFCACLDKDKTSVYIMILTPTGLGTSELNVDIMATATLTLTLTQNTVLPGLQTDPSDMVASYHGNSGVGLFAEFYGGIFHAIPVHTYTFSIAATGIATTLSYSVSSLASKAFTYNDKAYAVFALGTSENIFTSVQQSIYITDLSNVTYSEAVAKGLWERGPESHNGIVLGAGHVIRHNIPIIINRTDKPNTFVYGTPISGFISITDPNVIYNGFGILEFDFEAKMCKVVLGKSLLISSGFVAQYSGSFISELPFLHYPVIASATPNAAGGVLSSALAYSWVVVFEWNDLKGQIYRSAPSLPTGRTFVAGNTNQMVIVASGYQISNIYNKVPSPHRPRAVLYRTKGNGSIYYRVTSVEMSPASVTLTDNTITDANLTIPLYTTGGVLDNVLPQAPRCIGVHNNRLWQYGIDGVLNYSKEYVEDYGLAFNDGLRLTLDNVGGEVSGLVSLGGQLLIIRETAIQYIYGEGPNDLGIGQFSIPQALLHNIGGIVDTNYVVSDNGVVLPTHKGLYLLDKSGALNYIGAPIEKYYSSVNIVGVSHSITDPKFSICLKNGNILVYDTHHKIWSIFELFKPWRDIVDWDKQSVLLDYNGDIVCENKNSFKDIDDYYSMELETGWIKTSNLLAYQRIYNIFLLGEWQSPHDLQVEILYDYEDVSRETIKHSFQKDPGVYELRICPAKQKCKAIKLKIKDLNQSGSGKSMILTGLRLEIGVKGKIPFTRSETR